MKKKYTLYSFPMKDGNPKEFNFKFIMWIYVIVFRYKYVNEYRNNKTNQYVAYWI